MSKIDELLNRLGQSAAKGTIDAIGQTQGAANKSPLLEVQNQVDNLAARMQGSGIDPTQFTDTRNPLEKMLNLRPDQNLLFDIFEVINRPQQALFGGIQHLQEGGDFLKGMEQGLTRTGAEEFSGGQILRNMFSGGKREDGTMDWTDWVGFGLDVFADPADLAFLPVSAVANVGQAATKLTGKASTKMDNLIKGGMAALGKTDVNTVAKVANVADDVMDVGEKTMASMAKDSYKLIREGEKFVSPTDLTMRALFGTVSFGLKGADAKLAEPLMTVLGKAEDYGNFKKVVSNFFNQTKAFSKEAVANIRLAFGEEAFAKKYMYEALKATDELLESWAGQLGVTPQRLSEMMGEYWSVTSPEQMMRASDILLKQRGAQLIPYSDEMYESLSKMVNSEQAIGDLMPVIEFEGLSYIDLRKITREMVDQSAKETSLAIPKMIKHLDVDNISKYADMPLFEQAYTDWYVQYQRMRKGLWSIQGSEFGMGTEYLRNVLTEDARHALAEVDALNHVFDLGGQTTNKTMGDPTLFAGRKYGADPITASNWIKAERTLDTMERMEKVLGARAKVSNATADAIQAAKLVEAQALEAGSKIKIDRRVRDLLDEFMEETGVTQDMLDIYTVMMENKLAKTEVGRDLIRQAKAVGLVGEDEKILDVSSHRFTVGEKSGSTLIETLDPEDYNRLVSLKASDPNFQSKVSKEVYNAIGSQPIPMKFKDGTALTKQQAKGYNKLTTWVQRLKELRAPTLTGMKSEGIMQIVDDTVWSKIDDESLKGIAYRSKVIEATDDIAEGLTSVPLKHVDLEEAAQGLAKEPDFLKKVVDNLNKATNNASSEVALGDLISRPESIIDYARREVLRQAREQYTYRQMKTGIQELLGRAATDEDMARAVALAEAGKPLHPRLFDPNFNIWQRTIDNLDGDFAKAKELGKGLKDGTYDLKTGKKLDLEGDDSYMVSFEQSSDAYTPEEYNKIIKELMDETGSEAYLGVYGQPEISFKVATEEEAMALAKRFNQESIYFNGRVLEDGTKVPADLIMNPDYNPATNQIIRDVVEEVPVTKAPEPIITPEDIKAPEPVKAPEPAAPAEKTYLDKKIELDEFETKELSSIMNINKRGTSVKPFRKKVLSKDLDDYIAKGLSDDVGEDSFFRAFNITDHKGAKGRLEGRDYEPLTKAQYADRGLEKYTPLNSNAPKLRVVDRELAQNHHEIKRVRRAMEKLDAQMGTNYANTGLLGEIYKEVDETADALAKMKPEGHQIYKTAADSRDKLVGKLQKDLKLPSKKSVDALANETLVDNAFSNSRVASELRLRAADYPVVDSFTMRSEVMEVLSEDAYAMMTGNILSKEFNDRFGTIAGRTNLNTPFSEETQTYLQRLYDEVQKVRQGSFPYAKFMQDGVLDEERAFEALNDYMKSVNGMSVPELQEEMRRAYNAIDEIKRTKYDLRQVLESEEALQNLQNTYQKTNNKAYHYGDLGIGRDTTFKNMGSSRGTGHFGTGTYFLGEEAAESTGKISSYAGRPLNEVNFDDYATFKPATEEAGFALHDGLKEINAVSDNVQSMWTGRPYTDAEGWTHYPETMQMTDREMAKIVREAMTNGKLSTDLSKVMDDALDYNQRAISAGKIDLYYANLFDSFVEEFSEKGADTLNRYSALLPANLKTVFDDLIAKTKDGVAEVSDFTGREVGDIVNIFEGMSNIHKASNKALKKFEKAGLPRMNKSVEEFVTSLIETVKKGMSGDDMAPTASTNFMKMIGYEGIDVRGLKALDNTTYGSVIYDVKKAAQEAPEAAAVKVTPDDFAAKAPEKVTETLPFDYNTNDYKGTVPARTLNAQSKKVTLATPEEFNVMESLYKRSGRRAFADDPYVFERLVAGKPGMKMKTIFEIEDTLNNINQKINEGTMSLTEKELDDLYTLMQKIDAEFGTDLSKHSILSKKKFDTYNKRLSDYNAQKLASTPKVDDSVDILDEVTGKAPEPELDINAMFKEAEPPVQTAKAVNPEFEYEALNDADFVTDLNAKVQINPFVEKVSVNQATLFQFDDKTIQKLAERMRAKGIFTEQQIADITSPLGQKWLNKYIDEHHKTVFQGTEAYIDKTLKWLDDTQAQKVFETSVTASMADLIETLPRTVRSAKVFDAILSPSVAEMGSPNSPFQWIEFEDELVSAVKNEQGEVIKTITKKKMPKAPLGFKRMSNSQVQEFITKIERLNNFIQSDELLSVADWMKSQLAKNAKNPTGQLVIEANVARVLELDYNKVSGALLKFVDFSNNLFKRNKLLSLAFNIRNSIGITTNMFLSGMEFTDIARSFARADNIFKQGPELLARAARADINTLSKIFSPEEMKIYQAYEMFIKGQFTLPRTIKQAIAEGLSGSGSELMDLDGIKKDITKNAKMPEWLQKSKDALDTVSIVNGWGNETVDAYGRMAVMVHAMENPEYLQKLMVQDPIAAVRLAMFDPKNLSSYETEIAKRVIPFYSFTKQNLVYHMQNLPNNAVRYNRIQKGLRSAWNGMGLKQEDLEAYKLEQMYIPIPGMSADGKYFAIKANLPQSDFGEFLGNPIQRVLASTSPLIRAGFEVATNKQIFTGQEISEFPGQRSSTMPFLDRNTEYWLSQAGLDVPMKGLTGLYNAATGQDVQGGLMQASNIISQGSKEQGQLNRAYQTLERLQQGVRYLKQEEKDLLKLAEINSPTPALDAAQNKMDALMAKLKKGPR